MPGGRPRKAHKLRALEGGRGKSRPLTADLEPPSDPLVMPEGLLATEKVEWKRHVAWLRAMKLETAVDAGSIEAMVRALCRARAADKVIGESDFSVELHNGEGNLVNVARRPEVTISSECWKTYTNLASKFGMDPAARAKLGGSGEKKKEAAGDVPPELRDASGG